MNVRSHGGVQEASTESAARLLNLGIVVNVARLVIRLFGEPVFAFDDRPWQWSAPPRCLLLLAHLALRRSGFTRSALASMLWPDDLDSDALSNLRRHIYRLQRALPPLDGDAWILTQGRNVMWNAAAPAWFDVHAFEHALADSTRCGEVVALYRGDFLEGFYDEHLLAERERLRAAFLEALLERTRDARADRDFGGAIALAEKLLVADEWREDAVRELLAAKYESGDRSGALAAYERFSRRLSADFASAPMAETTALRDAIRAGIPLSERSESRAGSGHADEARRAWKLPFTGRAAELEKLRAAWSRAARKSGGIAFVSGEAGIGKSRLSSELLATVRDQGGLAMTGTTSNPEGEPYQAIAGALRAALPSIGGAKLDRTWLAAIAGVLPEVRSLFPDLDSEELPIGEAQKRLFEAVARVFEALGKLRPVCVVLEDLHWAGPATIALLDSLAKRIGTLPVLMVVTFRNEESASGAALSRLRARLVQERRATIMPLSRLASDDIQRVVRESVPAESFDAALAGEVARLSEGNPLFVAQLLEGYLETRVVPNEADALRNVGEAIAARTRRLDAAVRAIAEVASTIGQHFRADIVAAAGGWNENDVLDALGELMDRALVRESATGALEYVFTHALIGNSVYAGSPPDQRAARHRRVAQVMERGEADEATAPASIARHWDLAGDVARAARAYLRAARASIRVFARDEAIAHARRALERSSDAAERFEALVLISRAMRGFGDPKQWKLDLEGLEAAAAALSDAERYAYLVEFESYGRQTGKDRGVEGAIAEMLALTESSLPMHRGEALSALGKFQLSRAKLTSAEATLTEAIAVCERTNDRFHMETARENLIQVLLRVGRGERAAELVTAMRRDVEQQGTPLFKRRLLNAEISVAVATEDMDLALRAGGDLLEVARVLGDTYAEMHALQIMAYGAQYRGTAAGVRCNLERSIELAQRMGARDNMAAMLSNFGSFELFMGRPHEAWILFERCEAAMDPLDATTVGYLALEKSLACLMRGDLASAREQAQKALETHVEIGERRSIASATTMLGHVSYLEGDAKAGRALFEEGIALARQDGLIGSLCNMLAIHAGASAEAGDLGTAREAAGELEALYRQYPGRQWYPTRVHWALATVARACGERAAAQAHAERGRQALACELARLGDDPSVAAYAALPFNRDLVGCRSSRPLPAPA